MQQIPQSASTSAPPSSDVSPVTGSRTTAAVSPTPELPLPVVYTPRGASVEMYLCREQSVTHTPGHQKKRIGVNSQAGC
jgi:hypothetical protein